MSLLEVVSIAIAMAMDALGLSISLGINPVLKRKNKIGFLISFAFFQFLFIFLGSLGGKIFNMYIASIPNIVGGIIIAIVGLVMIIEAFKNDDEDDSILIKKSMYVILGVSVSIDALVVGFTTLHKVALSALLIDSILVGLITLFICLVGFFTCRYISKINFICKYADFLGGLILIILGLKMIFF